MAEVTADQARAILKKDFANLVRKVREGKNLTQSERALLQSIAAEPEDGEPDTRTVARNLSELCEILGFSRPTLNQWRKMAGAETGGDERLKARKLLVEIETKEVKLAVLRGQSIPVEKAREHYGSRLASSSPVSAPGLLADRIRAQGRRKPEL